MAQTLLQFTLVRRGSPSQPHVPCVDRLDVRRAPEESASRAPAANLLMVDARGMSATCQSAAFARAAELRHKGQFRHGVLVCNVPRLPLVVAAMRSGLRDIVHEPLSSAHMIRLLRAATPGGRVTARQIAALAGLLRGLAQTPRSPVSRNNARREYDLLRRSEQLDNRETRLDLERAALEQRERELRAHTLRLERHFADLQRDADLSPPTVAAPARSTPPSAAPADPGAASLAAELDGVAARLRERAQTLDIRERMLSEMEHILLGQLHGRPEHPLAIDTRPPFPMSAPALPSGSTPSTH